MLRRVLALSAMAAAFAAFVPSGHAAGEEAFRVWSKNTDGDATRTKLISIPFAHLFSSAHVGDTTSEGSVLDFTLLSLFSWQRDGDYSSRAVLGNPFIRVISTEKDANSGSFDILTINSGKDGGDIGSVFQRWHEGERSGIKVFGFGAGPDNRVPE